jgi:hypothetical protein
MLTNYIQATLDRANYELLNANFDSDGETVKLALSKAFAETIELFLEHFGISFDENDNYQYACFLLTNNINPQQASAYVDPRGKGWLS